MSSDWGEGDEVYGADTVAHTRRVADALDALRAERAAYRERAIVAEQARDRLQAEVDVLRGVGCCEDRGPHEPPSGPCGACVQCLRRARDEAVAECGRLTRAHACEREKLEELLAFARQEIAKLQTEVGELKESGAMGCENPPPGCECPGCALARETWSEE